MIYGLYFKDEMIKDSSYINDEVEKVLIKDNFSNFDELVKRQIASTFAFPKASPTDYWGHTCRASAHSNLRPLSAFHRPAKCFKRQE